MTRLKNIFVSTTFAKDDSKISDVLAVCKKENISNVELGSNHIYEKNFKFYKRRLGTHEENLLGQFCGISFQKQVLIDDIHQIKFSII